MQVVGSKNDARSLVGSTIEICGLQHLVETEGDETALAFVAKEKLLGDVQFRGAISDFHPIKAQLQKADYDPLLVKYNHDDRYGDGNNFEVESAYLNELPEASLYSLLGRNLQQISGHRLQTVSKKEE